MKKFLTELLLLAAPLAALAQGLVGDMLELPSMHKYEAEVVAKAAKADTPAEARGILLEHADKSWAGAPLFFNLGNACYRLGDYAEAAKHYEASLAKRKFFHAYKNLGYALSASGKSEEARGAFLRALAISGGSDADILLWLADFHARRGDIGAALAMCDQALVYEPSNGAVCLAKCRFLLELELFAQAEKFSSEMYSKTSDARYLRLRARAQLGARDYRSAAASIELLKAAGAAEPGDAALLGDLYFTLGDFRGAARVYSPLGDDKKLENAALACVNAGDFDGARRAAGAIKNSAREKLMGIAEARSGNLKSAAGLLEKYCAASPSDMLAAAELADALAGLGRYRESLSVFSRLKADASYRRRAMHGILRCALACEDYFYALSAAREISREYPSAEIADFEKKLAAYCNELEKPAQ